MWGSFLASTAHNPTLAQYRSRQRCRASFLACFPLTVSFQRRHYFGRNIWLSSFSTSLLHGKHDLSFKNSGVTSSFSSLSAEAFAQLAPMVLLQKALRQYTLLDNTLLVESLSNHIIISREKFDHLCRISNVQDSESALQSLDEAAVVVSLDKGRLVHLRPVQYVQEVEITQSLEEKEEENEFRRNTSSSKKSAELARCRLPVCFLLTETQRHIDKLVEVEAAMRVKLYPAISKAARWRRLIWSAALFYAGTQLAVVAHLTYVEFDWDVMEPISYCLSIGTALLFLLYYVWYGEHHSYSGFDRQCLPKKVRQYAPKDFDWDAYEKVCAQLVEERKVLEKLREWARTH